jgi:hypothetical protein
MKKLILCVILALGMGVPGLSWAQASPKATPAALTNLGQVTDKARQVLKRLQKDKESGKIAEAQVKSVLDQVRTVRTQEKGYLKASGNNSLTEAQASELISQLNTINGSF